MGILGLIVVEYAAMVVAWRWLLRRWRLAGPGAPPRAVLGRQEYLARRSLRALLAFDFLVMFPTLLLVIAVFAASPSERPTHFPAEMLPAVLGLVMFAAAIPGLRRSVVRLEQRRREGLPEETAAEIKLQARSTGHAALDAHLSSTAWGTNGAGLVIVLVSVAAWVAPDGRLLLLLAKDNEAVRNGEVWRLLTVALVHSGLMHLVFNVSILLDVGATLERLAGTNRMLVVLIVGTAAGSALSVAVLPQLSVGASGGVLALAAALVSLGIRHRAELPAGARKKLVRAAAELVALNVVLTFVLSNVDWAAHLGGIVAGAVIGWSSRLSPAARRALAGPPGPDAGVVAMPGARPEGR